MSKKIIKISIIVLILISIIAIYNTIIHHNQNKKIEEFMNYINSKDVDSGLQTPQFIHVVLATYKGKAEGLNITKSITYFINNTIPEINKKCRNSISTKMYYNNHKIQIEKQLGIDNYNDFKQLAEKCRGLSNTSTVEYVKFSMDEIHRNSDNTEATLHLKYDSNDEISFDLTILNEVYSDRTSVNIK